MGKHVDRLLGGKTVAPAQKVKLPKIEENKAFKQLVEKVGNLELAVSELSDKLLALKGKEIIE
jgi:hypothetical protein